MTEPEEAGSSHWYTDRKFTISITAFLLILPLSIPKEIGFQKYARWVGEPCGAGGCSGESGLQYLLSSLGEEKSREIPCTVGPPLRHAQPGVRLQELAPALAGPWGSGHYDQAQPGFRLHDLVSAS